MKQIYQSIPFYLIFVLFIVLVLLSPFKCINIWSVKTNHISYYSILFYILALLPIFWLRSYNFWKNSTVFQKIILVSLLFFLNSLIFTVQQSMQSFALFALIAFSYGLSHKSFSIQNRVYYLFFAYFLWHVISLLWADKYMEGLVRLEVYSLFVFIPLAFCSIKLSKETINALLLLYFRFMGIFVLISLCCWIYQNCLFDIHLTDWIKIQKKEFGGLYAFDFVFFWTRYPHPTYNAIGYLFAIPIGFYFLSIKWSRERVHILEFCIYLFATLLLVIITQSRIGYLGWICMTVLGICWMLRRQKKLLFISSIVGVVLFSLLLYFNTNKIGVFLNDEARMQNFKTAFYSIKLNPIWGTGVEGIRTVLKSQSIANHLGYPYANVEFGNPHHQFIGDLMQTGIIGLIIVSVMTVYLFVISIKKRDFLLFSFMVLFFLLMQTEMPFYLPKGVSYFLVFVSLLIIRIKDKEINPQVKIDTN